mmetsp:Transcript_41405/g.119830  ORF Transcript_41405/g.119830 Transcript_41405/m.119830 type:complete len:239 (+) Transcript_41405:355-1071(+)
MKTGMSPMPIEPVRTPTSVPMTQWRPVSAGRSQSRLRPLTKHWATMLLGPEASHDSSPSSDSNESHLFLITSRSGGVGTASAFFSSSCMTVRGQMMQQSAPAKDNLNTASGAMTARCVPSATPGRPQTAKQVARAKSQHPPWNQTQPPQQVEMAWEPRLVAQACSCVSLKPGSLTIPWMLMMPDPKPTMPAIQPESNDTGTASKSCIKVAPPIVVAESLLTDLVSCKSRSTKTSGTTV